MNSRKSRRSARPERRPLALQRLEDRGMLAGTVTISLTGTQLNVVGDSAGNSITLDETAGVLTIAGIGTVISGPAVHATGTFTHIKIAMNAGDDTVAFLSPSNLAGKNIFANLGPATLSDIFTATDLTAQDLLVTTGNGSDAVTIDGYIGRNLNVKTNGRLAGGAQTLDFDDLTLTGAFGVNAGAASDPAPTTIDVDDASVTGASTILFYSSGSSVDVDDLSGSALTIRGGATADIDLGTVVLNDLTGALTVTATANASITVGAAGLGNDVDGLATITAGGNSTVSVVDVEFNNSVLIKSGGTASGTSNVALDGIDIAAKLTINVSNGAQNIVTLDDDDAAVDIGGAVSIVGSFRENSVSLQGAAVGDLNIGGAVSIATGTAALTNGDSDITLQNVTIVSGMGAPGLKIATRNASAAGTSNDVALDDVSVDGPLSITTGNAATFNTVDIDGLTTGWGVSIILGTSATAQHQVDILDAVIGVGSYDLTVTAAGGAGLDLSTMNVNVGRHVIVTSKPTGDDIISIDGTYTGADDLTGGLRINTYNGDDSVTLGTTASTTFIGMVSVIMGLDNDFLYIGFFVDDSPGTAFDISNYLIGFDGGDGVDTVSSIAGLPSFIPSSILLNYRIKNFETRTP